MTKKIILEQYNINEQAYKDIFNKIDEVDDKFKRDFPLSFKLLKSIKENKSRQDWLDSLSGKEKNGDIDCFPKYESRKVESVRNDRIMVVCIMNYHDNNNNPMTHLYLVEKLKSINSMFALDHFRELGLVEIFGDCTSFTLDPEMEIVSTDLMMDLANDKEALKDIARSAGENNYE